jgi:hypothetical protein
MNLYSRIAGSHLGSSLLFGGAFFAATLPTEGLSQAAVAGALASASWLGVQPLLKRVIGGIHGA